MHRGRVTPSEDHLPEEGPEIPDDRPGCRFIQGLLVTILLMAAAFPGAASGDTRVIYPLDRTAVRIATIPILGVVSPPGRIPRVTLNGGGIILPVKPDGTFNQSVRLRPGRNILKVDGKRIYVSFLRAGAPIPKRFSEQFIHQPVREDCGNCHDLSTPGDFSTTEQGSALCLDCHDDPTMGRGGKVLANLHSPVKGDGGCLSCHDPHVGKTMFMNILPVPDLCYRCHESVTNGKKRIHGAVENGDCDDCHNPHGSPYPNLQVADGDNLCFRCHPDPTMEADSPVKKLEYQHEALDDGCTACHDPHASDQPAGLLMPQVELCGRCHDDIPTDGKGITVHSPIADDGECTGCHRPHGSDNPRLLASVVPGLCYECHDDVTMEGGDGAVVHEPVREGACTDCHNPHAGAGALLRTEVDKLCYECHDEFERPAGGSIHEPVGDGECVECHRPHVSRYPGLLAEEGTRLCYQCHDTFTGGKVHSPIADDDDCTECHNPHVGKAPKLLAKSGMALCLDCHDDPTALPGGKNPGSIHSPIADDADCIECHSPHAGEGKILVKQVPGLCYECHDDVTFDGNGKKDTNVHEPVGESACLDCHRPHAAAGKKLLNESGNDLCFTCHDDPTLNGRGYPWGSAHPPAEEECLNCHSPHGSDAPFNLTEDIVPLCSGCHDDGHPGHPLDASRYLDDRTGGMVSLPEDFPLAFDGTMVCTGCHRPHGAEYRPLFNRPKMDLCDMCHRV